MLSTLKSLIGVRLQADAASHEIEAALASARDEVAAATRDRAAAEAAYRDGLLSLEVADLQQLTTEQSVAVIRRDRAAALVEVLAGKLADAQAIEEQGRRRARYDAAAKAQAAAGKVLVSEYPKLARALVGVLRTVAAADLLAQEANEHLPDGVERLISVEGQVRREKNIPQRVLSDEKEHAWCRENGMRLDPIDLKDLVVDVGGTTGTVPSRIQGAAPVPVRVRSFRRFTAIPEAMGKNARPLASTLNLPGLRPSHHDFWRADAASSPGGVIQHLDEVEPQWGKSVSSTVQDEESPRTHVILLDEPANRAA